MARLLAALCAALILAVPAAALADDGVLTQAPEYAPLAAVASVFSMQPVIVTCSQHGDDHILDYDAWGYVYLVIPEVHMGVYLCDAALHVTDDTYGLSRRAIAVLVLTHEAYHLRTVWGSRGDEARTECKAIRHFRYAAQMLGASPELATQLRVYALSFHWRLAAKYPEYNLQNCKVPKP